MTSGATSDGTPGATPDATSDATGRGVPLRAPLTKAARQARIVELLAARTVASQTELGRLLAADGVQVTQATVSRDLEELGAVKVRGATGTAYTVPPENAPRGGSAEAVDARLGRLLEELLVQAEATGDVVVVRTPPGGAHLLGSALDRAGLPEVAGTVAGDDTVLLLTRRPAEPAAGALAARLLRLAEGRLVADEPDGVARPAARLPDRLLESPPQSPPAGPTAGPTLEGTPS